MRKGPFIHSPTLPRRKKEESVPHSSQLYRDEWAGGWPGFAELSPSRLPCLNLSGRMATRDIHGTETSRAVRRSGLLAPRFNVGEQSIKHPGSPVGTMPFSAEAQTTGRPEPAVQSFRRSAYHKSAQNSPGIPFGHKTELAPPAALKQGHAFSRAEQATHSKCLGLYRLRKSSPKSLF